MTEEVNSKEFTARSPAETEEFAASIARNLTGGEVIELVSDLGGGKTTFTRGLVKGLGGNDHVSSPTFTISNEYPNGRLRVCHFDMYRLSDPGLMSNELAEVIAEQDTVTVVEWADSVAHVLPSYKITVHISSEGENTRHINVTVPAELDYVVKGL